MINPNDPLHESEDQRREYYYSQLNLRSVHEVITEMEKEIMLIERAAFCDGFHKKLFDRSEMLRALSREVWERAKFPPDDNTMVGSGSKLN